MNKTMVNKVEEIVKACDADNFSDNVDERESENM